MESDAASVGAGTNGAAPKPAPEPSIFSTVDDAGSASVGRFPDAAARPDQYVAQTALAPASVPVLDLNAETLSDHRAERVALRDIFDDGAAPALAATLSPSTYTWQAVTQCVLLAACRRAAPLHQPVCARACAACSQG